MASVDGGFSPKTKPLNWQTVLDLDVTALQSGQLQDDESIESLYYQLVNARVDPSDPQCSTENLLKLFQATQLLIELQHIYNAEDQQKIKEQQQQINRLEGAVNGTLGRSGSPYGVSPSEMYKLQEDVRLLEERNHYAVRNLQISEQNLQRERDTTRDLLRQLDEQRAQNGELLNQISDLKREISELKLSAQQQQEIIMKQLNVQREVELHTERDRAKNAEISQYLDEIKALSERNANLESELDTVYLELERADKNAAAVTAERRQIDEALNNSDKELDALIQERDALRAKIYEIAQQMDWKDGMERSMLDSLQSQIAAWRATLSEHQRAILERDKMIESLQTEVHTWRSKDLVTAMAELERQLAHRDATINGLRQSLEQTRTELNSLLNRQPGYKSITSISATAADRSSERESYLADRLSIVEQSLNEKEELLLETRERLQRAEKGTDGLRSALDEVEELKRQRHFRDEELLKFTGEINECQRLIAVLEEENLDLRQRYNVPETFLTDPTVTKPSRQSELDRMRKQNEQLKRECRSMEDEVLELKKKLRFSALDKSSRTAMLLGFSSADQQKQLFPAEGLSAADWDRLKKELDAISAELRLSHEERNHLNGQLERFQTENSELQQALRQLSKTLADNSVQRQIETSSPVPARPIPDQIITESAGINANADVEQELLKALRDQDGKGAELLQKLAQEIESGLAKDKIIGDLTDALTASRLELDATAQQLHLLYTKTLVQKKRTGDKTEAGDIKEFIKGLNAEIKRLMEESSNQSLTADVKSTIVAQVTAQEMIRKCQLIETELKAKNIECASLADDLLVVEQSARQEILRLQTSVVRYKKERDHLENQLQQSVPVAALSELQQRFEEISLKYQQTISDQSKLVELRVQFKEQQQTLKKLQNSVVKDVADKVPPTDQMIPENHTERQLNRTIDQLKSQAAMLQESLKRSDGEIELLEQQLQRKEQELRGAQQTVIAMRAQLSQSVPRSTFDKLQSEHDALQAESENLANQVQFQRETSDTAFAQLQNLQEQQSTYEATMEQMKKNIQDLSVQSDHHALLSDLHQQIIQSKAASVRQQEQLTIQTRRCERLERSIRKSVDVMQQKDARIGKLKSTLASARLKQLTAFDSEIIKIFRQIDTQELLKPRNALADRCEWLSGELDTVSSELAECTARLSKMDHVEKLSASLMEAIQQQSPEAVKKRLTLIEKQIDKVSADNMALQRKLLEAQRKSSQYEKHCADLETHSAKIENALVERTEEYRGEIDVLGRRLIEMETELLEIGKERDQILKTSTASIERLAGLDITRKPTAASSADNNSANFSELQATEVSNDYPDSAWSIGRQLEFSIQKIADKNAYIIQLSSQMKQLKDQVTVGEDLVETVRSKLAERDTSISNLQRLLDDIQTNAAPKAQRLEEENQKQIQSLESRISITKEVNQSLQRQLQSARDQIRKYQEMLANSSRELQELKQSMQSNEEATADKLREAVCQLARRNIEVEMLRKQLNELHGKQDAEDEQMERDWNDAELFSLQDLRLALREKEQKQLEDYLEIQRLSKELEESLAENARLKAYSQRSEEDVVILTGQIDQLQRQITAERALAENTLSELNEANRKAALNVIKITRLTEELTLTQTQEKGLRSALSDLQERMVGMMQKQWHHQHEGVECATNKLRDKIARSEIEIARLKTELADSRMAVDRIESQKRGLQSKLKVLQSTGRPKSASHAEIPGSVFKSK